jgi:hypothetical protein
MGAAKSLNIVQSPPSLPRWAAVVAVVAAFGVTFLGTPQTAFAQDVAAAANAFARAQKAELAGDHDSAAELYELADSLVPTPEALRSALRARRAAGQLGVAALDAEKLLRRYPDEKKSRELADATIDEAKHKLTRLEVKCRPKACGVMLDSAAASADTSEAHVIYVDPGDHQVSATFGTDRTDPQPLHATAGDRASLTFNAPPEHKLALRGGAPNAGGRAGAPGGDMVPTSSGGLPPWVFATSAVITVGVGAGTLWSGLDTLQAHDTYKRNLSDNNPTYNARAAYDNGKNLELRTNVLIACSVGAAVATTIVGIFTRWNGPREGQVGQSGGGPMQVSAGVFPSGGGFMLSGSY